MRIKSKKKIQKPRFQIDDRVVLAKKIGRYAAKGSIVQILEIQVEPEPVGVLYWVQRGKYSFYIKESQIVED